MSYALQHTMFADVLHPPEDATTSGPRRLSLIQVRRRTLPRSFSVRQHPLVIFDFETTGLDNEADRIVEIGGLRIDSLERGGTIVSEFSSLIKPDIPLTDEATRISGITTEMLADQPPIEEQLPRFVDFFADAILVAHNAEFDMGFLRQACARMHIQLQWPCFCTLKMARSLLPELESKNLDTLAEHYGLTFEARHRSIGDCKVTAGVLGELMRTEAQELNTWADMQAFAVN